MGCAGVRRGLYSLLNTKVNNKFRIYGTINIRGVREREWGLNLPYNKVHYDLNLTAKHCYSLGEFGKGWGLCVIYCIDLPPSGCAVPSDRCAVSPETPCRSLADPGTDSANRKANILNNAQDEKFTKYFLCL